MPQRITSRQNPRIKLVARLRDRRGRDRQQRMIIDGRRETTSALEARFHVTELYYCAQDVVFDDVRAMVAPAPHPVDVFEVTREVFGKLAYGDRHDGVIAVATVPDLNLNDLHLGHDPVVVVLECVEKPGNVGAILRTAAAAGADAVLLADPATDAFNPNCIRASLGAIFRMPMAVCTAEDARRWLEQRAFQLLAARPDAPLRYDQVNYEGPTAVVLGSEAQGLSAAWSGETVTPIAIPMQAPVDSLNVSATAAVILYEAKRLEP